MPSRRACPEPSRRDPYCAARASAVSGSSPRNRPSVGVVEEAPSGTRPWNPTFKDEGSGSRPLNRSMRVIAGLQQLTSGLPVTLPERPPLFRLRRRYREAGFPTERSKTALQLSWERDAEQI